MKILSEPDCWANTPSKFSSHLISIGKYRVELYWIKIFGVVVRCALLFYILRSQERTSGTWSGFKRWSLEEPENWHFEGLWCCFHVDRILAGIWWEWARRCRKKGPCLRYKFLSLGALGHGSTTLSLESFIEKVSSPPKTQCSLILIMAGMHPGWTGWENPRRNKAWPNACRNKPANHAEDSSYLS